MGCLKMVLKGNLSEMISNWQISIGYEDNQIMTITKISAEINCLCWASALTGIIYNFVNKHIKVHGEPCFCKGNLKQQVDITQAEVREIQSI